MDERMAMKQNTYTHTQTHTMNNNKLWFRQTDCACEKAVSHPPPPPPPKQTQEHSEQKTETTE